MKLLIKILAGAIPGIVVLFSSILFFLRCRQRRRCPRDHQLMSNISKGVQVSNSVQGGFHVTLPKFHNKSNLNFHHLNQNQNQIQQQFPPFNWDANPPLITEVVENGWSRFVFADRSSVPRSSPLWSLCAACDAGCAQDSLQIDWEVQPGTTEFMQTVRINPGRPKKSGVSSCTSSTCSSPVHIVDHSLTFCTRMSLPLPGPPLIGSSFPQEAYFEIKILHLQPPNRGLHGRKPSKDGHASDGDDDRLKLIEENHCKLQSDALVNAVRDAEIELKGTSREAKSVAGVGKASNFLICLGLTTGDSNQTKSIPGTYPGSIGFQSNGSVYLDGITLVSESNRTEWAAVDRVIGCGYSPTKKKVFFTVDSTLVHVIRCNSEAYRSPLYPVLAANLDVMVSVNLGQAAFKYAPANTQRTTNPSFLRSSPSFSCNSIRGYEDSNELFSMGMEDSERSYYDGNSNSKSSSKSSKRSRDYQDDASLAAELEKESDLFEIALN